MRRHAASLAVGCALALPTACGDETRGAPDPACRSEVELDPRPSAEAALRGSVRVRDERDTSAPSGTVLDLHRGRVTAAFGRLDLARTGTPAASLPLGDGCLGLTSRPTPSVSTASAGVARLAVANTAQGRVEAAALGEGRFAFVGAPLLGAGALGIEAAGASFPGFSAELVSVAPMELLSPDPRAPVPLPLEALEITWVAGSGDAVWIELTPVPAPGVPLSGGQVVCRVPDDGCHVVPEAAIVFLRSTSAARYVAAVRRERVRVDRVGEAEVFLEASSAWRFELAPEAP